jgi:hypothetical protein
MLVAAVNVLVVVTLILVSVISERAVRLVKQRLRRGVRLGAPSALTDARRTDIIVPTTEIRHSKHAGLWATTRRAPTGGS